VPCNHNKMTTSLSNFRNILYNQHQVVFWFGIVRTVANGPESQTWCREVHTCLVPCHATTARITLKSFQIQDDSFWEPSASHLIGPHCRTGHHVRSKSFAFITLPLSFLGCNFFCPTRFKCCTVARYLQAQFSGFLRFLVCYADTQLATQLQQRCIEVVRSNKEARKRLTESNSTPAMDLGLMNVVWKKYYFYVLFDDCCFEVDIRIRRYTNKRSIEQNKHEQEQICLNCNKCNVWFWHVIVYVKHA